jgi:hypothetical protein
MVLSSLDGERRDRTARRGSAPARASILALAVKKLVTVVRLDDEPAASDLYA